MGGTTNPYYLGIDLGTTYTAAAVGRDGRTEMATLGNRAAVTPSVLLLRDDGQFLYGEAAELRGEAEPQRLAREFKRRLGDPVPLIVDRTPFAADALMAKLLRWVVDAVARTEGGPPAGLTVTHPANWGDYKRDLLRQALRINHLDQATLLSEPEAAAIHYATQERLDDGATVAVYDLGGGTFDAAVLRRDGQAWTVLGDPEGVERLGGVDVDEAVFAHVARAVDITVHPDQDEPAAQAALHRLRRDCVSAKEVLSEDTDTSIPVLLPGIQTQVRLTRAELEAMIRPALAESIVALNTALRSAGVSGDDLDTVLLVGGSSRIPLVAQLVGAELGCPVVTDAHPKHSVALGAAAVAQGGAPDAAAAGGVRPAPIVPPAEPSPDTPAGPTPAVAPGEPTTAATVESPETREQPQPSATPRVGYGVPAGSTRRPETYPPAPQPGGLAKVVIGIGLVVVLMVLAAVALFGNLFEENEDDPEPPEATTDGGTAENDSDTAPEASPTTAGQGTTSAPTTTLFLASEPPLSQVPIPSPDLDPYEARHDIVESGTGTTRIGPQDEVTFQFVGRLTDGSVFVNSWETSGEVTDTMGEGRFIQGFEQGLYGLSPGARAEVYIGSEAAYGTEGYPEGNIPPDSHLAYLVDIIAVNGEQRFG